MLILVVEPGMAPISHLNGKCPLCWNSGGMERKECILWSPQPWIPHSITSCQCVTLEKPLGISGSLVSHWGHQESMETTEMNTGNMVSSIQQLLPSLILATSRHFLTTTHSKIFILHPNSVYIFRNFTKKYFSWPHVTLSDFTQLILIQVRTL